MGLNQTPAAERIHIGLFGRRNAGKSSVLNAVTGQELAVVSDVKGTTTDPVYKAMELLPVGPVIFIDTPGIDDEGELGQQRVKKSYQVLNKIDLAIIVVDACVGMKQEDCRLLETVKEKQIPYLVVFNKVDLINKLQKEENYIFVSASTRAGIDTLKEAIGRMLKNQMQDSDNRHIVKDLLLPSDLVILVVPIDKAAPKGRLILPQQQTIRDILDGDAVSIVVKENELKHTLARLKEVPRLVITDSQVFERVAKDTPKEILLTSFSILFARYKGNLASAVSGVRKLDQLEDGDRILISEGCTHHRQCEDIGTVKLPKWIREYSKKDIIIETTSGTEFPDELGKYKLIIHCGGCMLNEREMKYRINCATDQKVAMTNYGIAIAYMKGILKRSVEVFPEIKNLLDES